MSSLHIKYISAIVASLVIGALVSNRFYHEQSSTENSPAASDARTVLFWYDPMKPDVKFDKPGKSPFMDMDLVPKYADEAGDGQGNAVRIDPTQVQNLGLKTVAVTKGQLQYSETLPANVSFNEYQAVIIQARSSGFVEKVYPLTNGDQIKKGQALIDITIPEWVEAQSEYLLLAETGAAQSQQKGVLERLRLAGMPEADIRNLRSSRRIQTRFTLRAPIDGVLTAFDLRSGMNIAKDSVIANIQGVDPVWISAVIPESLASLLHDNPRFDLHIPAYPEQVFQSEKWDILPSADPVTRTLPVRLQVANPRGILRPGMNATLTLRAQSQPMLLIPAQAVIDTGGEQHVITRDGDGRFVPRRIRILQESRQQAGVVAGLAEGESVVVNGLFLIDSEANINGALARMRANDEIPAQDAHPADHAAHGGEQHD